MTAKVTKLIGLSLPLFLNPINLVIFAGTQNGEYIAAQPKTQIKSISCVPIATSGQKFQHKTPILTKFSLFFHSALFHMALSTAPGFEFF